MTPTNRAQLLALPPCTPRLAAALAAGVMQRPVNQRPGGALRYGYSLNRANRRAVAATITTCGIECEILFIKANRAACAHPVTGAAYQAARGVQSGDTSCGKRPRRAPCGGVITYAREFTVRPQQTALRLSGR